MDNNQKVVLSNRDKVLTSLIAGAIAGALAKTTIAPLDRTKIYFQTTPSSKFSTKNVLIYLKKTYKTSGIISLWRGNSATMARIIPYAAIQFTSHEQYKILLDSNNSEIRRFLCGSLAGVTAQSLTYPLDMTRARLAVSNKNKYVNLIDVFRKIFRTEHGMLTLYRGYSATMLGVIPYAGCSFYTYESLKKFYFKKYGFEAPAGVKLIFGASAGVLGQTSSYPFDIVRRRLQVNHEMGNTFQVMRRIARTEGIIKGLYKGLSMNWIKGPVAAGISFTMFDFTQHTLRDHLIKL